MLLVTSEPYREHWEQRVRRVCVRSRFMCDHMAECRTVAVRGPEPPAGGARGLLQTATSCERVSTFCNRMCDHGQTGGKKEKEKKNALGVEMSCEQLGSTTEHLRGVIDSRQCF